MKLKIVLFTLLSLSFAKILSMHQIDEAMDTCNVERVKEILEKNKITAEKKQELLKEAKALVSNWKLSSKSLFRSPQDMKKLLIGAGIGTAGCATILSGLSGAGILSFSHLFYRNQLYSIYLAYYLFWIAPAIAALSGINPLESNWLDFIHPRYYSLIFVIALLGIATGGGFMLKSGHSNIIKAWKMSDAYAKLSNANQIQQAIEDIEPADTTKIK